MKDKGSVWSDSYEEIDEISRLYKKGKISSGEFKSRKSAVEKRLKAASKEANELIRESKKERGGQ